MNFWRPILAATVFAFIPALDASAQDNSTGAQSSAKPQAFSLAGLDWLRLQFATRFNREPFGWTIHQAERQFGALFDAARVAGGEGISAHDARLAMEIARARVRAEAIRDVLSADLNGDGKVTRDEVRSTLRQRFSLQPSPHREARMQREFDKILRHDRDRNGTITLDEIRQSVDVQSLLGVSSGYRGNTSAAVPMALDRNGDGVLMRDEFMAAVRIVFDEIDGDKDKALSDAEFRAFMLTMRDVRRRQSQARRNTYAATRIARQIMRCSFPKLPDNSRIVFASTFRGQALANVSFAGEQRMLTATQIDIEPGSEPLTLVLSAPAMMVWQVTGATQRVAKVLVGSRFGIGRKSSIAVSGVAADKVHFFETSDCLPTAMRSDEERDQVSRSLKALTGANVAAIVHESMGWKISLPSGRPDRKARNPAAMEPPKNSPGGPFWQAARETFPAGILRLEAKSLVSQTPVVDMPVLPGRAGLAQLIDQGALELAAAPLIAAGGRMRLPVGEMRIVAPIRLPAGLSRGIVQKFVLARNVKTPAGLMGQVCVVSEADGSPVPGSGSCR